MGGGLKVSLSEVWSNLCAASGEAVNEEFVLISTDSFNHSPQCLHFIASSWISSAQKGHFFTLESSFYSFRLMRQLSSARRASVSNSWFSPQRSGGEIRSSLLNCRVPHERSEWGTLRITGWQCSVAELPVRVDAVVRRIFHAAITSSMPTDHPAC
jgi:hypothetical protein